MTARERDIEVLQRATGTEDTQKTQRDRAESKEASMPVAIRNRKSTEHIISHRRK